MAPSSHLAAVAAVAREAGMHLRTMRGGGFSAGAWLTVALSALAAGCGGYSATTNVAPTQDAGTGGSGADGGVADAGVADAGDTDAGIDAGAADAGVDAGDADAGTADAGTADAGDADAGTLDAGAMDAGAMDAGAMDAGTIDGGNDGGLAAWCNGTHCYDGSGGIALGGAGPWPTSNEQFTSAQGIQEQPVVGATTDEAQNLWVATNSALYLMKPGQTSFRRFSALDGLHLPSNPIHYCDTWAPAPPPDTKYPYSNCGLLGAADAPGITEIVGGGPNEVFVGYAGQHHWDDKYDGTYQDPLRHSGKLDRIRVATDGTIIVDRFDLVSGNTPQFWHNRYVWRLIYDHFKHPHELYVGTDHGVDRLTPDTFRYPLPGEFFHQVTLEYMSDHLHPQTCFHAKCSGDFNLLLGDWRGLAFDLSGDLWVAGRWTAGLIPWVPDNAGRDANGDLDGTANTGWFQRGGNAASPPYKIAMGDPYCGTALQWIVRWDAGTPTYGPCDPARDGANRPVFETPYEGDVVSLSAVAVTPDGSVWFASGVAYGSSPNYGVARLANHAWTYFDPVRDLGMAEANVQDLLALPDGRLVLAGPYTGLVVYDPASGISKPLRGRAWLPSDHVFRVTLDTMVAPPALHVATSAGIAVLRQLP